MYQCRKSFLDKLKIVFFRVSLLILPFNFTEFNQSCNLAIYIYLICFCILEQIFEIRCIKINLVIVKEVYEKIHFLVVDDDLLDEFIFIVVDDRLKMLSLDLLEINE